MDWNLLHRNALEMLGFIPSFLSESDPRDAVTQLNEAYAHGGGWRDFHGFTMTERMGLKYPGDPELLPIALTWLRDEEILVYPHAWVAVASGETFRVARMD